MNLGMKGNITFKIILLFAVFSLMIPAYILTAEAAKPTTCTGTISSGTLGNVVVPVGESCVLNGSVVVRGNIVVEESASLTVSGIMIKGNVQANEADGIVITAPFGGQTEIGKNVQIQESSGGVSVSRADIGGNVLIEEQNTDTGCIGVSNNIIGGNLVLHENAGSQCINVGGNTIGGNLELTENKIPGEFLIETNTIGGNLVCADNDPLPSVGGQIVAGDIECESL